MKAIYVRISTPNQKMERQLKKEENTKLFIDIESGATPFLERKDALRLVNDDTITLVQVKEVSRLGRNLRDILNTIEILTAKGVNIYIENQGLYTLLPDGKPNPTANMIIAILGTIAQQEREVLLERTQEGVAIAKAQGKYKGRKRGAENKAETINARYALTIKRANELIKGGYSINYIADVLKENNKQITDKAKQYPGANRMTLTKLKEMGLIG
jgi:DNA invertase Pin-like site-specific DNA recombinase